MVYSAAWLFLVLAVTQAAVALPADRAGDADLQHLARARRTVLLPVAKAVLDPLNVLGRLHGHGAGSDAHSGSLNLGATLPFGISAGISASSSDAHSAAGGAASAGSNAGGGGHPGNYGGAGSSANVGPACPYCH